MHQREQPIEGAHDSQATPPTRIALVEERFGFKAETDHLVLHGICAACREAIDGDDIAIPRVSGAHLHVGDN